MYVEYDSVRDLRRLPPAAFLGALADFFSFKIYNLKTILMEANFTRFVSKWLRENTSHIE